MHELGLMQSAIDTAVGHARRCGKERIHRLTLEVGMLSGVDPNALSFAFEAASAGTIAESATLEVQSAAAVAYCDPCRSEFVAADVFCICPACGEPSGHILRGADLTLLSLEAS
jgi:hydrogenase nickel incorporation protein HypA/HybF